MDVETHMRLKAAIQAAADSIPEGQIAVAGSAYHDAYDRFRPRVRDAVPEELHDEFDEFFPSEAKPGGVARRGGTLRAAGASSNEARALLLTLAGWLQGHIDGALAEAKRNAEADAYAKERVKAERGIGFRRPDQS
jgi:hypothetical protein